jgi:hypothetical protein
VGCSKKAKDWAYQYTATNELVTSSGRKYSENFEDYAPMCRSCHRAFDIQMEPRLRHFKVFQEAGQRAIASRIAQSPDWLAYRVQNMSGVNRQRRKCTGCLLVSNPGAMAMHQKKSGHSGWEIVTA